MTKSSAIRTHDATVVKEVVSVAPPRVIDIMTMLSAAPVAAPVAATVIAPVPGGPRSSGLHLHVARDHATLVAAVVASLGASDHDPFGAIPVVVPGQAQRRHLSQAIALDAGICAGFDFLSIGALRRQVQLALLGIDPGRDAWRGRGMALAVLDAIDENLSEPWLSPVVRHLRTATERPGRRMATALRLTRNFREYVQRAPSMLLDWTAGNDVGADGRDLPPTAAWQPPLWRAVRGVIAQPDPVERHAALLEALRSGPVPGLDQTVHVVDLLGAQTPDRLLLEALATHHDVQLWMVEHEASNPVHPLAASWGRARRDVLAQWRASAADLDVLDSRPPSAGHLLSLVQADVASGTVGNTRADDRTIEIHASHGPDRQVEVLRDVLCGLFDDDPTLEPRDVIVACTDLDGFAPHIHAAFGLAEASGSGAAQHPGHHLRVQVAASSTSVSNPAFVLLRTLLSLPGSRATSQDLVDLCSHPLVARRFGFSTDDLASITVLVEQSGVRWGLDRRHRAAVGLGDVVQGTWTHALDRMLASVALPAEADSALGDVLGIAAVDSGTVSLLGRLAELVARVDRSVTDHGSPASVSVWVDRFHRDLDDLASVPLEDAWILAHAHGELADLADLTGARASLLTAADARALIDGLLRPARARANHGNGSLLFTSLDDVAGVPHRVVCVLGMDSDHFPPRRSVDGDDLLGGRPRNDGTDGRALARQRLLDALMGAGERFVVVYQGRDARTNAEHPVPVVLAELFDACSPHLTGGALEVVEHSLQPQSESNFDAAGPRSFDSAAWVGAKERAKALAHPAGGSRVRVVDFSGSAPPLEVDDVELASLVAFYKHPARELLKATIGVSLKEYDRGLPDELPLEVDVLATWGLASDFLSDGLTWDEVVRQRRLTGALPPGLLGSKELAQARDLAGAIAERARPFRTTPERLVDVAVDLPSGQRISGTVTAIGSTLLDVTPSWISGSHLVDAWLRLVCVAATDTPATAGSWRAVLVGKGHRNIALTAPDVDVARSILGELAAVRTAGLRSLVPLPPKSTEKLLRVGRTAPMDPDVDQAAKAWVRECDQDWAALVGSEDWADLAGVRFTCPSICHDWGVVELAEWFWGPVGVAHSLGVRV